MTGQVPEVGDQRSEVGGQRRTRGAQLSGLLGAAVAWSVVVCAQPQAPARRIVSLVPAATQMLVAIGARDQLVGVSSYDRGAAIEHLPRVGALLDPDLERMLALRPDLVIVHGSQAELRAQLGRARIATFPYVHGGLDTVLGTVRTLGERTGRSEAAGRTAGRIAADLDAVRTRVAGRPRPRVLLVFGRDPSALRNIYVSGGVGFLHDLLEVAGGRNVMADAAREGLQIGTEQILVRAPEVILEIRPESPAEGHEAVEREAAAAWAALPALPAVRGGRVHVLHGPQLVVPGPHVAEIAAAFAQALHPRAGR